MSVWQNWGVSRREIDATYPCEAYAPPAAVRLLRGISVAAPAPVVFRWVCQIKVAPYSYDWIDNFGRRSPRTPTPGADQLAVGQDFLIFRIVEFRTDEHITTVLKPGPARVFGPLSLSYSIHEHGEGTRLIGALCARRAGLFDRARLAVLAPGDLVMMRKQLRTLRDLAEATHRGGGR